MAKIYQIKSCLMLLLLLLTGSVTAAGQTVVFEETFDKCTGTGGNDGTWSDIGTSASAVYDNDGWSAEQGNGASKCVRAGSSKKQGSFTTPALSKLSGDATLTFDAGAWKGDATTLLLEISGGGSLSAYSVTINNQSWTACSVTITGGTSSTKVTFKGKQAKSSRFFLDNVKVTQTESGTTPAPYITPESKNFMAPFTATITAAEGASVYYTTNGDTPTAESTLYTEDGVLISGAADVTLKAIAVKDGVSSDVTEETYTFVMETPTVSPESQYFNESLNVTVAAPTTDNTEVCYTTDGSDPTTAGTAIAKGADDVTLTLTATTTVKAATKYTVDGTAHWSDVVTNTYTLVQGGDDTKDATVIWEENFDGYSGGTLPSAMTNDNATYAQSSEETKVYTAELAGGTKPELLLKRSNTTLTINITSLKGKSGELMLSFLANKQSLEVTATGAAVKVISCVADKPKQYAITVPAGTESLNLVIKTTGSDNVRLDNFMLAAQGTAKVTEAGYATLYTDKAFIMPEGVTGQTVTSANSSNSVLTVNDSYKAGSIVPAKTALLLKGDAAELNYTVVSSDAAAPADNMLHGTLSEETTDYTEDGKDFLYYKLAYNNDGTKLGFYWGAADGAAFANAAGKAYLAVEKPAAGASAVSGFAFEDVVSAIESAAAGTDAQSAAPFRAYDMSGRRVQAASKSQLRSGLYIVNGKKLIIK